MTGNDVVRFSDAAMIAVHALNVLAASDGTLVSGHALATAIGASENHLAKVMQRLVKAGMVASSKGPAGGFALAQPADTISFRAAIEAIDGSFRESFCPFRKEGCNRSACLFGDEVERHSKELISYLERRTFARTSVGV